MTASPGARTVLRTLGLAAAASIAICNMIGQGVFLKARAMTCNVGSPTVMLGAWLLAGVLALCGALTLAELGASIPQSGGLYAFFRRAYGDAVAFAYGWMVLFISSPASIAALGAGAAIFFNLASGGALDRLSLNASIGPLHLTVSGFQLGAILLIAVVTAINCAPALVNGQIATTLAGVKIAMLVVVTFAAFVLGHGSAAHFTTSGAAGTCDGVSAALRGGSAGFAAALIGALYAYSGWHSLTFVAGEIKRPGRTIPIALVTSVLLVIVLYVAANAAFVFVLAPQTITSLAAGASVGITVVRTLFGPTWQILASAFLCISVAATLHVTILTNSRVIYALAHDGLGVAVLARLSRNGRVPVNAVLVNGLFGAILVMLGSFDTLSDYMVFNTWVFFVAAGVAMFVLRRDNRIARPYLTLGYPLVPAAYVLVGAWLVVQTLLTSPGPSFVGLAIVALSFPVYLLRRRSAA